MGFVHDSLATMLTPHALPPLAALPLAPAAVVPTGNGGDDDNNEPPKTLNELLAVEPGLIDLILAAGAANKAADDPAVLTTCRMVQAWLGTHRLGRDRRQELVLWKTLAEAVFPNAPVPPDFPRDRSRWTLGDWRWWFQEMCRRVEQYEKVRAIHERLAAESHVAQQDLHDAQVARDADLKRVRREMDRGNDAALPDENVVVRYKVMRRIAKENKMSEETALITMNEDRLFLTQWDPFPPIPVPVGAAPVV
jgi:hypothetical protein